MDRRKFIKTSMCVGCGAAILPASQSKLVSQLAANFSRDRFVYKRKEDMPKKIRLEACTLCFLNCPICWLRLGEERMKKANKFGYLKFSDFKNLIDDNPQIKVIELAYSGEIFLNPELDKIIEYAHKKDVRLEADNGTNLNRLSEEMAECLVVNKFGVITASIDGATPESYKIYRRGGDFNKVIANIEKINYYKQKYNSEFPILNWKFILFGHNEHEIELAKQKAKELNMNIRFQVNYDQTYSPVKNIDLVYKQSGVYCGQIPFISDLSKNNLYVPCRNLFEEPQINWDGTLLGCCSAPMDGKGPNVFEMGLMNALNSEQFIDIKHMVTDLSYTAKNDNFCVDCCNYKMMKDVGIPIKV